MKEKYNKLKSTERGRLKLKFMRYMVFFLMVLILVLITDAKSDTNRSTNYYNKDEEVKEEKSTKETLNYLDKQKRLITDSYKYKFTITSDVTIIYSGSYKDEIRNGYKETDSGIIKYREENDKVYLIQMDESVEYSELYTNLDASLFNFDILFNKLNSLAMIKSTSEDKTLYTYEGDYKYVCYVSSDAIDKIEISNDVIKYTFEFDYEE